MSINKLLFWSAVCVKPAFGNTCFGGIIKSKLRSVVAGALKFRNISVSKVMNEKIKIIFISKGEKITAIARDGDTFLDVVKNNELGFIGYGACGGCLACSTCRLIFKPKDYEALPPADGEEQDMLDVTEDISPLSRLGCQVIVTKDLDGIEVIVPDKREDRRFRLTENGDKKVS